MYKQFREITSTTPISQLPEIISYNNELVREEMEYIYDSSTGRLIKSVYVPYGKVQAYTGEFRNLSVDSITINNPASLINNLIKRAYDIPHNAFASNFSNDTLETIYENVNRVQSELICHDASVVAVPPFSHKEVLGFNLNSAAANDTITLYNVIESVANKFVEVDARMTDIEDRMEELSVWSNDEIEYPENMDDMKNKPVENITAYPKTYMYATIVQLKRQGVPPVHIDDLKMTNAQVHTYYPVANPMTINNDTYAAIECWGKNRIINVKFERTHATNPFMILMNRHDENGNRKYLKVTYNSLNCLQLICTGYSDQYGTVWSIYSWSGSPENFEEVIM